MKHLPKLTALLLALVLCLGLLPVSVLAAERNVTAQTETEEEQEPTVIDSGYCGAPGNNFVYWALTDDGLLTISGYGKIQDFNSRVTDGYYIPPPWRKYHDQIKKVIVEDGVTYIGSAFLTPRCAADDDYLPYNQLDEVEIAGTVTRIGDGAFVKNAELKRVIMHDGLKYISTFAFKDCKSLEEVRLPGTLRYIYGAAFHSCTSLKEIDIPESVIKCSDKVFQGCTSLERVTFHGETNGFGNYVFKGCTGLKEITLPSSNPRITRGLFLGCTSLERIVIPATEEDIWPSAFRYCSALKEVCYLGTPEQWAKIDIMENNYHLLRAASYNLPLCNISTKYTNYTYTGSEVKPVVTVRTLNDVKLKKGTNYTVSYENNEDYGTATITITGIGKYSGTTTRTFRIRPAKVQDLTMDRKTSYADLTWTANPEATSYRIYKSGVLQGETTDTHYHLTGLTSRTNCTVTVKAVVKRTNAETGETETFLGMAASLKVKPIS